ncbi:uncharacterized protein VP01_3944g3 [Puccinia sorghi]|uniref:Reverse transcriptase Ty1/copia-type domain-containing protein n=1 Tax=Puccinia sorghi TaxID=27349 RepID=A0A0L6USI7_9BASI|nr:uncharacterized protein VP01_3944g3 [Puccinia sorghi]
MDVRCMFLNGNTNFDVCIKPPEGVAVKLKHGEGLKLNKSLYSLKQSPRMWPNTLLNFLPAQLDPCLFLNGTPLSNFIYFHVDDLVIAGKNINFAKDQLKKHSDKEDLGKIKPEVEILRISGCGGVHSCSHQWRHLTPHFT